MKSKRWNQFIILMVCLGFQMFVGCSLEKSNGNTMVQEEHSVPLEAAGAQTGEELALEDGTYTVDVILGGGTGRASVESPAKIIVKDGQAYATIVWSSNHYDYMIVEGEKYLSENAEGNSTFTIPVLGFNYEMPVIADTTAMSTSHEIEYTLYFEWVG